MSFVSYRYIEELGQTAPIPCLKGLNVYFQVHEALQKNAHITGKLASSRDPHINSTLCHTPTPCVCICWWGAKQLLIITSAKLKSESI